MREEYDFSNARRGPVLVAGSGKTRITIRLDDDVLEWFKAKASDAGGGNYQTLINATLRRAISEEAEPLEAILRRVVREELAKAG